MSHNEPLILYGPHIILSCTILYWGLTRYLEYFLFKDQNDD